MSMLEKAIEYAEHVPIFPLVPNTKIPFKNSNGYKDATQDIEQIKRWWSAEPHANVSTVPSKAGIFVFDVDLPDGVETLKNLGIWQRLTQKDQSFQGYKSWSGGIHLWFKTDSDIIMKQSEINLWKDVDVLSNGGIIVPPSIVKGKAYTGNLDISQVPPAPDWLVTAIEQEITNKGKLVTNYKHLKRTDGSYTGSLLEKIVNGSDKGERNNWLTSIAGSLFNTGMDSKKILILLHVINQNFISPPLNRNEVDSVFKSILRKEMANY